MSGLHWEGAQMTACTSRYTCKMYLISSHKTLIFEIGVASDMNF